VQGQEGLGACAQNAQKVASTTPPDSSSRMRGTPGTARALPLPPLPPAAARGAGVGAQRRRRAACGGSGGGSGRERRSHAKWRREARSRAHFWEAFLGVPALRVKHQTRPPHKGRELRQPLGLRQRRRGKQALVQVQVRESARVLLPTGLHSVSARPSCRTTCLRRAPAASRPWCAADGGQVIVQEQRPGLVNECLGGDSGGGRPLTGAPQGRLQGGGKLRVGEEAEQRLVKLP